MFRRFNVLVLMLLIIGQTILGPIGVAGANTDLSGSISRSAEEKNTVDITEIGTDEVDENIKIIEELETQETPETLEEPVEQEPEEPSEEQVDVPKQPEVVEDDKQAVEVQEVVEEELAEEEVDELSTDAIEEDDDVEKHGFKLNLGAATDLDGNSFDNENSLDPADEFRLKLEWNLTDGHNYVAGDKENFNLPKGIKITEEMTGELRDESKQLLATYKITSDKKVELTFTDFIEGHSTVKGWLEIISTLDEREVEVEDGEAIIDPIGEEGEIRIPIEQGSKEKTIEKKGTPNKGYNADEINWEVIINKNKTSLTDAKVTDLLPKGTEYKENSLKVIKLKADINGNILGDAEEIDVTGEAVVEGVLTIPLGDIKDAYRIEYITTVTDDEEKQFKNKATLSDEDLEDISAESTITINRGEAIKKRAAKGYDPKTGIIEWEIEFNYNEKDLTDVTLTDAWTPTGKMDLVEGSLGFTEVEIDENGHAQETGNVGLPNGAELVPGEDGFKVTGITTDRTYKVTYQTKVKDRVLDGFEVANTAGFGTESSGSGTGVGTYYGSKSAGAIDYAAKTIDWKIEVNHDEYLMEKISIEDTLGEGLTLLEDSIEITVGGQPYDNEEHGDYTVSGDNPFTITFPNDFKTDKKIEISYKTEFDADNVPDHKPTNKAAIMWTPGGGGDPITKEVEAETELNWDTKENHWKNGWYNPETKEITWTIYTNYRENDINNLIVTDAPQGNQKIVADSVIVTELVKQSDGGTDDGEVLSEDVTSIDETNNSMTVTIGKTNKAYKIEYKTSLAGLSDIQKEYVNKAEVLDGIGKLAELDAKVGIAKSDTYGEKSGYQEGKQVHWSVKVNLGQQKINRLKLEDTISENQEYLVDTIKVYHATVDGNGNAQKGDEVLSNQYGLTHTPGDLTFTVEWKNEVERAFIVEYSTLFFEQHGKDVTNTYKVTGVNIIEDGKTGGDGVVTIKQLSSGGGSGEAGYLVIDKVGKKDGGEAPLAGAEFDLVDPENGNVLKSGITDEDGQIDFGRLLFGEYELYERVVPDGYVTKEKRQTIIIDKKYELGEEKESFYYKVLNFEPVFAIELSKTDDEDNALEGAEFTLFDAEDNEIKTATTDENGKILFEGLENSGTYYVQETKAPAGFVLDTEKHYVNIGEKEPDPVGVSVENTPRGAVQLTKTDVDTKEVLAGVEFELQKKNDSGEYEKVSTHTTDENGQIQTKNTLEAGEHQFVEVKGLDGYRTNEEKIKFTVDVNDSNTQKFTMTNEKFKGSVKLTKSDAGTKALLAGAEFQLVDVEGKLVEENLVTNDVGEFQIDNLLLGKYQLIETKAPEGYELDETPIDVEITEDLQVVEKTMTNNKITDVSVEKKWNNAGGETTSVMIKLLPTDKTVELNEENEWQSTFKDLRVYDGSGKKIKYEVEELDVEGYKSTVTGDSEEGFIVTNTELTSVSGTKTWLDDGSDQRPTITVVLSADGEKVAEVKVDASSDWKYEFANLEKYDESGEEIKYTIDEVKVDGYEKTIDGFDLTNLRVGKTEVSGTKTWLDDDSEDRPESITVNLLANGEKTDKAVEVNGDLNWEYEFTNLDKYNNQGEEITYTVDELVVPEDYEKSLSDNNNDITNLRVGTTEVEITKLWKDENEWNRPDAITVNLLRNGIFYQEYEVTKENGWKLIITDLPQYDDQGAVNNYSVTEHDVPGYASAIDRLEITNTRADVKSIEITKAWLDNNSKDRPVSIEVELFRSIVDGEKELVQTIRVTAADDWVYEQANLPAFDADGKAYTYEISEKTVEGYETSVNGFDLTNLRVGETSVEGTKTWKDDNASDRPEVIEVNLLQNGKEVATQEIGEATDWKYNFTKLAQYDEDGKAYAYTVEELAVDGYESTVTETEKGFDITNVRVGETSVEGTKTWKDDNATDRPDKIEVNLLKNGVVETTVEVTAENDWVFKFEELAQYDENGKAYEYAVKEQVVPGYKSEVDGFNITNIKSEKTSVPVTKGWKDGNATDRPDSIQVNLLRNGEPFQEAKVTAENEWKHEFKDLEAYNDEGEAYEYTIEEEKVKGYETKIDGFDITNTRVGTTSVEGTKSWKDDNATNRPEMIKVDLLQNGEGIDTVEVTAETDWTYSFEDLVEFDENGVAYAYTVKEQPVAGYTSTVDGYNITNTLNPAEPTEPVEPRKPTEPTKPQEPNKPTEPVNPSNPGDNGNVDKPENAEKPGSGNEFESGKLPQTGEEQFMYMIALGVLLLAAGGIVLYRQRRKA